MITTMTISGADADAGLVVSKPRKVNGGTSQRITIKGADSKSKTVISVVFAESKAAKKQARK